MKLQIAFQVVRPPGTTPQQLRSLGTYEIGLRCLAALISSIEVALVEIKGCQIELTILDDHSNQLKSDYFRNMCQDCDFATRIIPLSENQIEWSLIDAAQVAREARGDLYYLTLGDVLHAPSAIFEMLEAYQTLRQVTGREIFIGPWDSPEFYKQPFASQILQSPRRYWRSVAGVSGGFMTTIAGINQVLTQKEILGFTPMPSLAVRMGATVPSAPFVDWPSWWNSTKEVVG